MSVLEKTDMRSVEVTDLESTTLTGEGGSNFDYWADSREHGNDII